MKSDQGNLRARTLTLAIRGALAAMVVVPLAAMAEGDEDVAALVNPTNVVEVGVSGVDKGSDKFGEYNGLNASTATFIGNFGLRGGDGYGQGAGTHRWSVTGIDLGTTSRELEATMSDQGKWKIGIGFDQLRHAITDTYQTPLQGSMGGNSFIMPQGFGVVSTFRPAAANPYGTQVLTQPQQSYLHTEEVHSERQNTKFSAAYNFDPHWSVQFDVNHLKQSGAKLIGSGTDGNVLAPGFSLAGYAPGRESIQILMNPTNYTTDQVTLALNWVGDKGYFTGGYYGSRFRDGYDSVNFSNPFTSANVAMGAPLGVAFPINSLSTAPDNDFHQFNLTGGYDITPTTKLVGGYSYARNTQNVSYINQDQMQVGGLPQSSLDGLVITTHADLKLTNRTTKDLTLSAGAKYNERDNRTASYTYDYFDLGAGAASAVNIPMSNKRTQGELAADYRITTRQNLHLGYEYEKIERWCNNAAANNAQGVLSAVNAGYYTTASCVQVPESRENKGVINYRLRPTDDLSLNAGYTYSRRKSDVNSAFYNPMQSISEGFENHGFIAFFDASRVEHTAKAGLNWQATPKLNVSVGGRVVYDKYDESDLGVQNGHGSSANFDATYSFSDKSSVSAYASRARRSRELLTANGRNAVAPLPNDWTNGLSDDSTTLGLGAKQRGLMHGKLDLGADLTYSLSKTTYSTSLNYVNASCTTPNNAGFSCGSLPDIRSELVQLKLTGGYNIDKARKLAVGYVYQKLNSNDYFYNYYQLGYTGTTTMPTNQQDPSYKVNLLFVTYSYSFR